MRHDSGRPSTRWSWKASPRARWRSDRQRALEEIRRDVPAKAGSFMDYAMPRADDSAARIEHLRRPRSTRSASRAWVSRARRWSPR